MSMLLSQASRQGSFIETYLCFIHFREISSKRSGMFCKIFCRLSMSLTQPACSSPALGFLGMMMEDGRLSSIYKKVSGSSIMKMFSWTILSLEIYWFANSKATIFLLFDSQMKDLSSEQHLLVIPNIVYAKYFFLIRLILFFVISNKARKKKLPGSQDMLKIYQNNIINLQVDFKEQRFIFQDQCKKYDDFLQDFDNISINRILKHHNFLLLMEQAEKSKDLSDACMRIEQQMNPESPPPPLDQKKKLLTYVKSSQHTAKDIEEIFEDLFIQEAVKRVIYATLLACKITGIIRSKLFKGWIYNFVAVEAEELGKFDKPETPVIDDVPAEILALDEIIKCYADLLSANTLTEEETSSIIAKAKKQPETKYFDSNEGSSKQSSESSMMNLPLQQEDLRLLRESEPIKEQHANLKDDLERYPKNTFERAIQEALFKAFQVAYGFSEEDLTPFIENLTKVYNAEKQYITTNQAQIQSILCSLGQKKSFNLYSAIKHLKKDVIIIDVLELARLIKKTNFAKQMIKDKDVIFVIGDTGSGKTTTILKFLGFSYKKVNYKDQEIYVPAEVLLEQYSGFYTSPEAISCTRYINAVDVPKEMQTELKRAEFANPICICDSPGFDDTGGVEIDLANQIGMINALMGCSSVRVVVIMSRDSILGKKCQGVIQMAQILSNLCPSFQQIQQSFHFYFNKAQKKDINIIKSGIKSVLHHKNQLNISVKAQNFVLLMQQCAQVQDNYINPITEDIGKFKKRLGALVKKKAIDKYKIADTFRYTFAERTKKQLGIFVTNCIAKIRSHMAHNNYERVKHYYSLFKIFDKQFSADGLEQRGNQDSFYSVDERNEQSRSQESKYANDLKQMQELIVTQYTKTLQQMEKNLKYAIKYDENELYYRNVQETKAKVQKCAFYFAKQIPEIQSKASVQKIIEDQWKRIKKNFESSQITKLEKVAKSMRLFASNFKELGYEQQIQSIKDEKQTEFLQLFQSAWNQFQKDNYELNSQTSQLMLLTKVLIVLNEQHFSATKLQNFKKHIEGQFDGYVAKIIKEIESDNITRFTIKEIVQAFDKIDKMMKMKILEREIQLKEKQKQTIKKVQDLFKDKNRKLQLHSMSCEPESLLSPESISAVKKLRGTIDCLMQVKFISDKYRKSFEQTLGQMKKQFDRNLTALRQELRNMLNCPTDDIEKYEAYFDSIKKTFSTVIKYSQIINKEQDTNEKIAQLVASVLPLLSKEASNIEKLDMRSANLQNSVFKINGMLQKIKAHKIIIFQDKDDTFQPLKKENRRLQQLLDKQISKPIYSFTEELTAKSQKVKSVLLICADKLNKMIRYIEQIKQVVDLCTYKEFNASQADLEKLLEGDLSKVKEELDTFLASNSKSSFPKSFKDTIQKINALNSKPQLLRYLSYLEFSPTEYSQEIKDKFKQIYQELENEINNNALKDGSQEEKILSQCKELKAIQKYFGTDLFEELSVRIKQKLQVKYQDFQTQAKTAIELAQDITVMFQDLKTTIDKSLSNQGDSSKSSGNTNLLSKITTSLQTQYKNLTALIKAFEKKAQEEEDIKNQDYSGYVKNCIEAVTFYQLYTDLCSHCAKYKVNLSVKVSQQYNQELEEKLADIFSTQFQNFMSAIRRLNLSEIKQSTFILKKMEVFCDSKYYKTSEQPIAQAYKKLVQTFKQQIGDVQLEKIDFCELKKQRENKNIQQLSLKGVMAAVYNDIKAHIARYHSDEDNLLDQHFKIYYQGCDTATQKTLKKKWKQYFEEKIAKLGLFEENKQLLDQVELLPIEIRRQISKQLGDINNRNSKQFQEQIKDVLCGIKETPSSLQRFIELVTQMKSHLVKDSNQYHYCLLSLANCLSTIISSCNGLEELSCLINSHFASFEGYMSTCKLTQLNQTVLRQYNALCYKIKSDLTSKLENLIIFFKGGKDIRGETTKMLNSILKIANTISAHQCGQHPIFGISVEKEITSGLYVKLKEMLTIFDENAKGLKGTNIFSQETYSLEHKFELVKSTSPLVQIIRKECNVLASHAQNLQIQELNKLLKDIDPFEAIIYGFKKMFEGTIQKFNKFDFDAPIRQHQSFQDMSNQFDEINLIWRELKQRTPIMKKCLTGSEESLFNLDDVQQQHVQSFLRFVEEIDSQINNLLTNVKPGKAIKTNIFYHMSKIIKNKQPSFIKQDLLEQETKKVANKVKGCMQNLNEKQMNQLEQLAQQMKSFEELDRKIPSELDQKRRQLKEVETNKVLNAKNKHRENIEKLKGTNLNDQETKNKQNQLQSDHKVELNIISQDFDFQYKKVKVESEARRSQAQQNILKICNRLVQAVIIAQKAVIEINYAQQLGKQVLQQTLNLIQSKGQAISGKFVRCFVQKYEGTTYGNKIVQTQEMFSSHLNISRRSKVKDQDIDYVTKQLRYINKSYCQSPLSDKVIDQIKGRFKFFNHQYEEQINKYQRTQNRQQIVERMRTDVDDLARNLKYVYLNDQPGMGNQKVILLARIFALLSIKRQNSIRNKTKRGMATQITFKPHEIQVVSLMLLLGLVIDNKEQLGNRLAEVGTGEGKSVVLGVLSTYLALVGFNVRCSCYSLYLSKRDQEEFKELFDFFGIEDKIKYGTFNHLCEEILNTGNHDFKKEAQNMIMASQKSYWNKISAFFGQNTVKLDKQHNAVTDSPTILLLDQADVFFDQQFYGSSYRPAIKLQDETVTKVFEFVWNMQKNGTLNSSSSLSTIKNSTEFKDMVNKYPTLKELLQNQINGMIRGALSYQHNYFIVNDMIVYKDGDSTCEQLSYGYKTVFANLYEYEKGTINKTNLDKALSIDLIVAEFAYSILPKYFKYRMGVTGTIKALPLIMKKVLRQKYQFTNTFIVPSSFGINQKKEYNYFVVQENQHYPAIVKDIKQLLNQRPVIVFFKNSNQLYDFFTSSIYTEDLQLRTSILTQQHSAADRERAILNATNPGAISLMTRSFGRGTDFQVFDKGIKENGGAHIIHTFLSEDEAEQIQIKGRTNRQNSLGSVSIIIKKIELEELNIQQQLVGKQTDFIYSTIFKARQAKALQKHVLLEEEVKIAEKGHAEVQKVYKSKDLKQNDLLQYVSKINQCPLFKKDNIRTVIAVDGTGSMSSVLAKVLGILRQTFERIYGTIEGKKCNSSMEIQLMIYRNYNSGHQLLQKTAFESRPDNLLDFLKDVRASGGIGEEAVQICLQATNKETQVAQLVLIGDAPYNPPQKIATYRKNYKGQQFWNDNGYPITDAEKEVEVLKSKGCPVYAYYLGWAKDKFNFIGDQTGGSCSEFPLNSPEAAAILSDFIVRKILALMEQKEKKSGNNINLLSAYESKYCKRYT